MLVMVFANPPRTISAKTIISDYLDKQKRRDK